MESHDMDNIQPCVTPKLIGVAISGGGHRATAYGLGVLLYLVDSGLNLKVNTITSVSGGSILNAFVALLRSEDGREKRPFDSFSPKEFDRHAPHLAMLLSGKPTIWFASIGVIAVGSALALALFLLSVIDGTTTLLPMALLLLIVSFLLGPKSGGSLWGWWGTWLYCSTIWILAIISFIVACTLGIWGLAALPLVVLCGWLFNQRHWVAEKAYAHTVCKSPGCRHVSSNLEDMNTSVRHVFCATEMHSGQHAYFSHDLVYARGFGLGRPFSFSVASAVQVSANFPGGFPIRPLKASRFQFSLVDRFEHVIEKGVRSGLDILMTDKEVEWGVAQEQYPPIRPLPNWLMLSDGGVFDNLAVDWYLDSSNRMSRMRMHLNWDFDPTKATWIERETNKRDEAILSPFKDLPESLIVVNAGVTGHWQRSSSVLAWLPFIGEIVGFSQISGTMYNNYTKERIRSVQQHLVVEMGFAERLVRTTLLPLGTHATARLMQAGYDDVMYAVHRRWGLKPLENRRNDFTLLARGKHQEASR
jgi:hypothetical protein